MENFKSVLPDHKPWPVKMGFAIGLALLSLVVLLWGLSGTSSVHADPGMLYVDGASGLDIPACGTSSAPCQTISYTVNSRAGNGDTIFVAEGTYSENLVISGITLTVRGGYAISGTLWLTNAGETIVDGGSAGRVFFIHDSDSVLENLTISGGAADAAECWGDALWVTGGHVTIRSSTIKDNNGGCIGIEVNDDYGPAHLTLESSTVTNIRASEGALHLWGGSTSAVVSYTLVYSNSSYSGGGIEVDGGSSAEIINSYIADNVATVHGGAVNVDQGTLTMTNVLLARNKATSGNANVLAINNNSDVTIMNCTIADNNPAGAQAVLLWSGALTVTNTIMWNNALNLQADPPCPTCFVVTYSDIEGGWTGASNINADPTFVDAASGDYHLMTGSPAIDTGTNIGAPAADFEGDPRPSDGDLDGTAVVDMGDDEFAPYHIHLPCALKN